MSGHGASLPSLGAGWESMEFIKAVQGSSARGAGDHLALSAGAPGGDDACVCIPAQGHPQSAGWQTAHLMWEKWKQMAVLMVASPASTWDLPVASLDVLPPLNQSIVPKQRGAQSSASASEAGQSPAPSARCESQAL